SRLMVHPPPRAWHRYPSSRAARRSRSAPDNPSASRLHSLGTSSPSCSPLRRHRQTTGREWMRATAPPSSRHSYPFVRPPWPESSPVHQDKLGSCASSPTPSVACDRAADKLYEWYLT